MPNFTLTEHDTGLRLNQRRMAVLRWWLLAAVAVAVSSAPTLLDIALPQLPMFAVILSMAGFNAYVQHAARTEQAVGSAELLGHLCVDMVALAVLLYLSGGASNPLISMLLVPVAVAALSLTTAHTSIVALLAIGIYSLLTWLYLPLHVGDVERAARLHLAGMWLTFVVSTSMIAWFVARMTASIRERDRQLAAAREQALRDERMVALGAFAAGAAHELGTPLATIAVVVGELARDVSPESDMAADLILVREQVEICKGIIGGMAARAGADRSDQLRWQDAGEWLRGVRARWHAMRPRANSRLELEGSGRPPQIAVEATLEQAVVNLLSNAADESDAPIDIRLAWSEAGTKIEIQDWGEGFPDHVLRQAGRGPLPSRHGGAGIGLLLAFSAIDRLGGKLLLDNPARGGARARIELPTRLEPATGEAGEGK